MCGAHRSIPIIFILVVFQRFAINVGRGGVGAHEFVSDFGSGGVDVRNAITRLRDAGTCTCCKFGLKMRKLAIVRQK